MPRTLVLMLATACTVYLPPEDPGADAQRAPDTLRVVTWNVETIGDVGSAEYDAALQILARLDADVVALQEVEWSTDEHSLAPFAADAGYEHVVSGWPVSFGDDTQVILSRFPITDSALLDGSDLSGDPLTVDLTRSIPVATIDVDGIDLTIATAHFKASDDTESQFRRTIDAHRAAQALGAFDPAADRVLFCGDLNEDVMDPLDGPPVWTYAPNDLPSTYVLGGDLFDRMTSVGLPNSPFQPLYDVGLSMVDAWQRDGSDLTRPESGRRLDYVLVSAPLLGGSAEVYDTADEHLAGLPMAGDAPTVDTLDAADHLPVVVDLPWPTDGTTPPDTLTVDDLVPGELRITELLPNPSCRDSDGEWVELLYTGSEPADLHGLVLCDATSCAETEGLGLVQPGDVVLLGRTLDACGVGADGTFSRPLNNRGGDTVSIEGSVVLDSVTYTQQRVDKAWAFDDDGACYGDPTPGEALDCDGEALWGMGGADVPYTAATVPAGELVLSEVLPNPAGCDDETNEWFEVRNDSDRDVDLSDLHATDAHRTAELMITDVVLAPGERAVFARAWTVCGVDQVDGTFGFALTNGGDELTLLRPDGEVLDQMDYGWTSAGDSWQPDGAGWCEAPPTPGQANASCW